VKWNWECNCIINGFVCLFVCLFRTAYIFSNHYVLFPVPNCPISVFFETRTHHHKNNCHCPNLALSFGLKELFDNKHSQRHSLRNFTQQYAQHLPSTFSVKIFTKRSVDVDQQSGRNMYGINWRNVWQWSVKRLCWFDNCYGSFTRVVLSDTQSKLQNTITISINTTTIFAV
jgi:hypothetical protein